MHPLGWHILDVSDLTFLVAMFKIQSYFYTKKIGIVFFFKCIVFTSKFYFSFIKYRL